MTTVKELNRFGRLMEARVENGNSDLNVLLSLSSKGRMNSGINTRHTIWVILGVARIIRSRLCLFYIERRPNNFFSGEFSLLYRLERILKLPGRRIFGCYPKLFSLPAAPVWEHSWNFHKLPSYDCAYTRIEKLNFNEKFKSFEVVLLSFEIGSYCDCIQLL